MSEWTRGELRLTTDPEAVDLDLVVDFLTNESYWAQGRTRDEQIRANAASTCFSLLHEPSGAQVGFARVLSDDVRFSWVMDVFVVAAFRGQGLGQWLTECVVARFGHTNMGLGTADAHDVYARHGFVPADPTRWMHRPHGRVERP